MSVDKMFDYGFLAIFLSVVTVILTFSIVLVVLGIVFILRYVMGAM